MIDSNDLDRMGASELEVLKEEVDKRMFKIKNDRKISALESQINILKQRDFDDQECSNCGCFHKGGHDEQQCNYINR